MTNEDDLLRRVRAEMAGSSGAGADPLLERVRQEMGAGNRAALETSLFTEGNPSQRPLEPDTYRTPLGRAADATRVVGQGAFGLGDEAEGAVRAAFTDTPYSQARDEARAGVERVRKEAPLLSKGLEFGGSLLATAPAVAVRGGLLAKTAASSLASGLYGAGASDAETLGGRAKAAVLPAMVGAAVTPLMGLVGRAGSWLARNPVKAAVGGAAGGAALSATDNQGGVGDTSEDALKGVAALALLPMIGSRALAIAPRIGGEVADQMVMDAAKADLGPDAAASVAAKVKLAGPGRAAQMRAMDLGENLLGVANTAAGVQGSTARAVLPQLVEERAAGRLAGPQGSVVPSRLGRMVGDVEDVFGQKAGRSVEARAALEKARAEAATAEFGAARASPDITPSVPLPGGGVMLPDLSPDASQVLAGLNEPSMRPAVNAARKMWDDEQAVRVMQGLAREPWNPRSVKALELISRAVGDTEGKAVMAGAQNAARLKGGLRRGLLEQVDPLAPEFATARGNFANASKDVEAAYLGSGQAPPGLNQSVRPKFTSNNYSPAEFARDWRSLETPQQKVAGLQSIVDDVAGALNQPAAQGQELKLVGRYADSNQIAKLREVLGDDAVNVLTGRQTMEEAMSSAERMLSNKQNSKTATKLSDIELLKNPKEWAMLALQRVWPQLRVSKPAANRIGDVMQLPVEDFVKVLQEMQTVAAERAQSRDLIPLVGGIAAGRLAGPSREPKTKRRLQGLR